MKHYRWVFLVSSLPLSLLHPFMHQIGVFYVSENAFQQPSAVLKLLQKLESLSLQWWISPSAFAERPGGSKTKTSFGSEGLTQNLMFTINVNDYFVLPDFHCGCTGGGQWCHVVYVWPYICEDLKNAPLQVCWSLQAGDCLTSPVHPATFFYLFCNKRITWGRLRGFFSIRLIQAIVPPCCSCSCIVTDVCTRLICE